MAAKKTIFTQGMSPYFVNSEQVQVILRNELLPKLKNQEISVIHYYGTGCLDPQNAKMMKMAISKVFAGAKVTVENDLTGIAKAACAHRKGIANILGTGSNSCYFDGKEDCEKQSGPGLCTGR